MTVLEWVTSRNGQSVDLDGAYGPQCVDLADDWANTLGRPLPPVQGAKDFAGLVIPGYTWVDNTPDAVPAPGDLVIWGTALGPWGHVAIRTEVPADTNSFQTLDQNWVNSGPNGSPAALVTHTYAGVKGWQHPEGGAPVSSNAPTPDPQQLAELAARVAAIETWRDTQAGPNIVKINQTLGGIAKLITDAGFTP